MFEKYVNLQEFNHPKFKGPCEGFDFDPFGGVVDRYNN